MMTYQDTDSIVKQILLLSNAIVDNKRDYMQLASLVRTPQRRALLNSMLVNRKKARADLHKQLDRLKEL